MEKVYRVELSSEDRVLLQNLLKSKTTSALKNTRARILLKADQSDNARAYSDAMIAEAISVSPKTVFNLGGWKTYCKCTLVHLQRIRQ